MQRARHLPMTSPSRSSRRRAWRDLHASSFVPHPIALVIAHYHLRD